MLHVAICDDDNIVCNQIESILINFSKSLGEIMEIDIFYSGESLCKSLCDENYYDIIFLDIELKNINGVEVGKKIRNEMHNESTQFVYISGKESYAMQLFDTRPLNFLLKPLQEAKIEKVMNKVIELTSTKNQFFEYKMGRAQNKVFIKDILYFSSDGKKINLVLQDETIEFYGKLSEIQRKFEHNDYIQIHKSFLVNYYYVIEYQYEYVRMSNQVVLPISQQNRKIVRSKLLERRGKG